MTTGLSWLLYGSVLAGVFFLLTVLPDWFRFFTLTPPRWSAESSQESAAWHAWITRLRTGQAPHTQWPTRCKSPKGGDLS